MVLGEFSMETFDALAEGIVEDEVEVGAAGIDAIERAEVVGRPGA